MPNMNWSELSPLQLGRYAEYYAKMEFASYGYEVYTSEVDDHGVDFVIKTPRQYPSVFYEVQVKAVRNNYSFIRKDKIKLNDFFLICYLRFTDGKLPAVYVFPSSVWLTPNAVFCDRAYEGKKSKPEWGISVSKKNKKMLEPYRSDEVLPLLKKADFSLSTSDITL